MRALWVGLGIAVCLGTPTWAQAVSRDARETGRVILKELTVTGHKLSFRVDSNGCTDRGSFRFDVARGQDLSPLAPHYRITVERTRIDECKALLRDGVVIEIDLEKDLGLKGSYTLSVENPVLAGPGQR